MQEQLLKKVMVKVARCSAYRQVLVKKVKLGYKYYSAL